MAKADPMEKKLLQFTLDIHEAQFNHLGRFFLKVAVQSLNTKDYGKIRLNKDKDNDWTMDNECATDTITQEKNRRWYKFQDHKFTFVLPKGFCKNDNKHDVYLLVEAFDVPKAADSMGKRVGEAKFAIYPRTNAPKVNEFAKTGEDLYNTTDVMTLLRTLSTENIQMHCGRLKYTAKFKEVSVPPWEYREPTPPPQKTPQPTPTPVPQTATPPPGPEEGYGAPEPKIPPDDSLPKIEEDPLSPDVEVNAGGIFGTSYLGHVSKPGMEQVDMIIHGAANLPPLPDGSIPLPFVTAKSKSDEDDRIPAKAVTHATNQPTHTPAWEEFLSVELDGHKSNNEVLVVNIADGKQKKILTTYRLPVSHLVPFHVYHLEMVMPSKEAPNGIRLFATIVRKTSTLPQDLSSPQYIAIEVLLRGVEYLLENPAGPLTAVARIVPDYYSYKKGMDAQRRFGTEELNLDMTPRKGMGGLNLTHVTFPSPHPSSFAVPTQSFFGYPQITLPGKPAEQPVWNHPFLFTNSRDKATIFTPTAALVLEYYLTTAAYCKAMTELSWRLKNPIGYSVILMDTEVYQELVADSGVMGVRVQGLPIKNSRLKSVGSRIPTVGLVMRIITSERTQSVSSVSDLELLPLLQVESVRDRPDFFRVQTSLVPGLGAHRLMSDDTILSAPTPVSPEMPPSPPPAESKWYLQRRLKPNNMPPRTWTIFDDPQHRNTWKERVHDNYNAKPLRDGELPPHDAVENVLPEYQYIFVDGQGGQGGQPARRKPPPAADADLDQTSASLLDYQMKELEKYRTAVHKMGQDILTLRQQIRDLEGHNGSLRRDLSNHNDATRLLLDSSDLDGLTKPELAARYVTLKQKLGGQTNELRGYKDRVQKLQNDMIRKNDQEKDYLKMSHAHASQNELLQKYQDKAKKVKKLEEAIKKQEKVIGKLERLAVQGAGKGEASEALQAENIRLRSELDQSRDQNRMTQKLYERDTADEEERLALYEKLDRQEGRIRSLEKQLGENSRQWGKERSDMMLQLQEHSHGLGMSRMSPLDMPKLSTTRSFEPRRYSKAPNRQMRSPKLDPLYN